MRTPLRGIGPPGDNEVFGQTMDDNHHYAMWDAAYVLGSLSAAERREFESHMASCPDCRQAVGELSGMPALLSQLDHADVAAIDVRPLNAGERIGDTGDLSGVVADVAGNGALPAPPYPRCDLGGIVRRGRGSWHRCVRRCSRLFLADLRQQVTASAQPMSQVGTTLLTSEVALSSQHWGTSINLKCVCLAPLNAHHDTLAMVVVGRDGSQTRLATWVAEPGHTATPAGSISTPVDQIAAVQVVAADTGQVLLQRSL